MSIDDGGAAPDAAGDAIALRNEALRLVLAPRAGASATRCDARIDGAWTPLLAPARGDGPIDPAQAALYPMVPWADRLPSGAVWTPRGAVPIARTWNASAYPIHGHGWRRAWRIADETATTAALALDVDAPPYRYAARFEAALDGPTARFALSVTPLDDAPLPYGLGLHPFFPRTAETRLTLSATSATRFDADELPIADAPTPPEANFADGPLIGERTGKALFHDVRRFEIRQGPGAASLVAEAGGAAAHLHLFAPSDAAFFCVEPVSHRVGAFADPDQARAHLLPAGQAQRLTLALTPF